jgi:hypothetical protein
MPKHNDSWPYGRALLCCVSFMLCVIILVVIMLIVMAPKGPKECRTKGSIMPHRLYYFSQKKINALKCCKTLI